jgi:hypothetical protein
VEEDHYCLMHDRLRIKLLAFLFLAATLIACEQTDSSLSDVETRTAGATGAAAAESTAPDVPPLEGTLVVTQAADPLLWGPFILYPAGTKLDDIPDERGVPTYPDLAGRDLGEDADVTRVQDFASLPAALRGTLRIPVLPADYELSGVWALPAPDGTAYRSVTFWHRRGASATTLETADIVVGRSLAAPPPI